jgi:hypothetical protein
MLRSARLAASLAFYEPGLNQWKQKAATFLLPRVYNVVGAKTALAVAARGWIKLLSAFCPGNSAEGQTNNALPDLAVPRRHTKQLSSIFTFWLQLVGREHHERRLLLDPAHLLL